MPVPSNANPFALAGGLILAPVAVNAVAQRLVPADMAGKANQADAQAEAEKAVRNFALLQAASAIVMGYASLRVRDDKLRGAALGGAIGSTIAAFQLGAALLTSPALPADAKTNPVLTPPAGVGVPRWALQLVGA